jgi:hypothetical protein
MRSSRRRSRIRSRIPKWSARRSDLMRSHCRSEQSRVRFNGDLSLSDEINWLPCYKWFKKSSGWNVNRGHPVYRAPLIALATRREGGHDVFTHSSFRPRFLYDETTMRPVNPATVHAVILSKEPMYNHIVDDTILHSGPRSSLPTRDDRRIALLHGRWRSFH